MAQATTTWKAYTNSVPNPETLQQAIDKLIEADYEIMSMLTLQTYQKAGGTLSYPTEVLIVVSK